jgi:hypothetical protein
MYKKKKNKNKNKKRERMREKARLGNVSTTRFLLFA